MKAGQEDVRGRLPPYVAYPAWQRLLDSFKEGIPSRVDGSYLSSLKFSASTRSMLKGALLFFGLIDPQGIPSAKLQLLVGSEGTQRQPLLREIIYQGYGPLLSDLEHATAGQLQEYLRSCGAVGDVGRKCAAFLFALAGDAGIRLPPYLRKVNSQLRSKRRDPERSGAQLPLPMFSDPPTFPWEALLAKFPDFDPSWPDEVKAKWFDDFAGLKRLLEGLPRQRPSPTGRNRRDRA